MPVIQDHGPSGGRNEPHPPGIAPAAEPGSWERLDRLLEELPPGYPTLPDEDRDDFSKYHNAGPRILSREEAWQNCATAAAKHDGELCKGYREEIDTLLVFAGLFSAVVTAFAVESYQWLQDDANDAVVRLLGQIAQSVARNDSVPIIAPAPSGLPSSAATRINACWFLALTLSLSAALLAILCKQWIREFERTAGCMPQQYVSVRQVKFEGLQRYHVGETVAALPLLLQLSLAVFALGVIELLWHLHAALTIVVGIPAILALAFYMLTLILPVVQVIRGGSHLHEYRSKITQCPYKSPQAWLVLRACLTIAAAWIRTRASVRTAFLMTLRACSRRFGLRGVEVPREDSIRLLGPSYYDSWQDWDYMMHISQSVPSNGTSTFVRALAWLRDNETHSDVQNAIWNCHWHEVLLVARMQRQPPCYYRVGTLAFAHAAEWNSHRMSTIFMLIKSASPCTIEFFVEIFVQNLMLMDPSKAAQFLVWISEYQPDTGAVVTLIRAVASYLRVHIGSDATESILLELSRILYGHHSPASPTLRACVATLLLSWLRGRENPLAVLTSESSDSERTDRMCMSLLESASVEWDFAESCDRVCDLPYVEDLAAMACAVISRYPHATGLPLPLSWPPSPALSREISARAAVWGGERTEALVLGLLEVVFRGVANCGRHPVASKNVSAADDVGLCTDGRGC